MADDAWRARVCALEREAFAAWPAAEIECLGGWRLRATPPGLTRRGNSVWPGAPAEPGALPAWIARARAFYAARELPARFQISPLAAPAGLDAALARAGFGIEAPVSIQRAPVAGLAGRWPAPSLSGAVEETLTDAWFELAGERSRFATAPEALRGFLARIGPRAGFALARLDGRPAAVGLGVLGDARVWVFSMLTLPEARRRGLGGVVLGALAGWAHARGADALYLQVERDNTAAQALYARAGFREVYGTHYRLLPA